jgi:hypothetical protein
MNATCVASAINTFTISRFFVILGIENIFSIILFDYLLYKSFSERLTLFGRKITKNIPFFMKKRGQTKYFSLKK